MRKAEREGGVRRVFGEDMGDTTFVSNDFDAGSGSATEIVPVVCGSEVRSQIKPRRAPTAVKMRGRRRRARSAKHGSKTKRGGLRQQFYYDIELLAVCRI